MARASDNYDIDNLSLRELTELLEKLEAAIPKKKSTEIVQLRARLEAVAADAGYTLAEIVGGGSRKGVKVGSVAPVKYRNPDDPSETWSGRGRTATWLAEKLKKRGVKIDYFAV